MQRNVLRDGLLCLYLQVSWHAALRFEYRQYCGTMEAGSESRHDMIKSTKHAFAFLVQYRIQLFSARTTSTRGITPSMRSYPTPLGLAKASQSQNPGDDEVTNDYERVNAGNVRTRRQTTHADGTQRAKKQGGKNNDGRNLQDRNARLARTQNMEQQCMWLCIYLWVRRQQAGRPRLSWVRACQLGVVTSFLDIVCMR
jgi:hypothetical protein